MRDAQVREQVAAVAKVLRIEHLLKKRPSALAGGDMQRVTIGRALVRRPSAMLMDEPIGALDAKLREEMRTELRRLHVDNDSTTVYVTHDQVEAMAMADKIGIMNDGVLQQYDNPDTVYDEPANLFVAQFVGSPIMNVADCRCELADDHVRVQLTGLAEPFVLREPALRQQLQAAPAAAQDLALGIRPEAVGVQLQPTPGFVRADVKLVEPLGAYDIVDIAVGEQNLRARTPSQLVRSQGQAVWLSLDGARTHFFDKRSGRSLRAAA
jgi:multiple sugar transport system ATP-binding protein